MRPDEAPPLEALHEFAGMWVAVRDGRVIAAQDSFDKLYVDLTQRRERGATLLRVPAEGEPEVIGFG